MSMIEQPRMRQLSRDAMAAHERGDDATAEQLSREVLAHNMEDAEALEVLSSVFVRTGRLEAAVTLNRAVLEHFRALHLCNSMAFGLHLMHDKGMRARGILDIGAYAGEFSLLARQFWPDAAVLMVEPQAEKRARLDNVARELGGDTHVQSKLLGECARSEVSFHQMSTAWGSTGSSCYPENSDFERTTVVMPMTTVDALLEELPGRCFDLMKVDVQGAELDVLRGAKNSLPDVEVLFAEVALHECNQGAPRLAEVVGVLDELGFAMFDMLPMRRDHRDLQLQVDAIFVRRDSALWPRSERGPG